MLIFALVSKSALANSTCQKFLADLIPRTPVVEALNYRPDGGPQTFLSPIPSVYQYPDELKLKFETLAGKGVVSPTALSILNAFPHQETDFKYVTLQSWKTFLKDPIQFVQESSEELNDFDRLMLNPSHGIKPIPVEEIFSLFEEPNDLDDEVVATVTEINEMKLVKIPYWFLIFYASAAEVAESEFPEADAKLDAGLGGKLDDKLNGKLAAKLTPQMKVQKKKTFQKTLGTLLHYFIIMTTWLNSQGLMSRTFSLENIDEIDGLPFSIEVKETLKKLINSGILFRFSNSDPTTDFIDLTDSWMESVKTLTIGSFKTYDAFSDNKVLTISIAGPGFINLWMNKSKKTSSEIKRLTIIELEELILHEALHAFSFSNKRLDLIGKYVQQKFGAMANEDAYLNLENQMLKSKPEQSRAEFRSQIAVSVLNLISLEVRSGGDIDFLTYKIKSLLQTVYDSSELHITDDEIKNLILNSRFDLSLTSSTFLLNMRLINKIESHMDRRNIVHAKILSFYILEISRTLEEFLAHKINNELLDSKTYEFYPWAVQLSSEDLAKNWTAFFDLPYEFRKFLD